jgi:hypothetical protein
MHLPPGRDLRAIAGDAGGRAEIAVAEQLDGIPLLLAQLVSRTLGSPCGRLTARQNGAFLQMRY